MLGVYALMFCFFVFMVMHDYSFFRLGKTYGAWDQMFLFCNELHDIAQFCVCTDVWFSYERAVPLTSFSKEYLGLVIK